MIPENRKKYYDMAARASENIEGHVGLAFLQNVCLTSEQILDVGCGEGTRLDRLLPNGCRGYGVDISGYAINRARKRYPQHYFFTIAQKLPFKDNRFDLVYSAFTLEHTTDPERLLLDLIRVCKPNGLVVIICPNYGSPNRRSPVSNLSPIHKLIVGTVQDFSAVFLGPRRKLGWNFVSPKNSYEGPDDDTTVEPYLRSALSFLGKSGMKIVKSSSLWQMDQSELNPRKWLFRILGTLGIYPFKYWGPQLFVAAVKVNTAKI